MSKWLTLYRMRQAAKLYGSDSRLVGEMLPAGTHISWNALKTGLVVMPLENDWLLVESDNELVMVRLDLIREIFQHERRC